MNTLQAFAAALLASALLTAPLAALSQSADPVAAAVADKGRPAADLARDADRKPAEMLAFAGVKPGDTVLEVLPGGGYFTRLISKAVGPTGHVYAGAPEGKFREAAAAIAADPAYANVSVVGLDPAAMASIPAFDLIWTSENYHDLHLTRIHLDVAAVDKFWFSKLKPGGVLVVIDHAALAGAPVTATADTLHRIDPAAARAEVESVGFVFDGESKALVNPSDPHTATVFDPSIRGHTDQFAFRFRKPA
jgi:predicted methyltransferase